MTEGELLSMLESLKGTLVSVATGATRIDDANQGYKAAYEEFDLELRRKGLENPIPYSDLWDWYGRWKSGDLPSYQSRRTFVSEMIEPLKQRLRQIIAGVPGEVPPPTGWPRVDRNVGEMRERLASATTEEQYQAVGLLCREALISLAQVVYDRQRHPPLDGTEPSTTDANRMLDAYLAVELRGGPNEEARKHAKAALALALALQHRRTADFRQAAMCVEGATAVINVIAIACGRRDPDQAPR
jgi:hypothetical protein